MFPASFLHVRILCITDPLASNKLPERRKTHRDVADYAYIEGVAFFVFVLAPQRPSPDNHHGFS